MACIKQSALKHSYYKISKSKQRRPVRQGGWTLILVLNIVTYTSSKTHQVISEKTVNYYCQLIFFNLDKNVGQSLDTFLTKRGKFESMFISGLNKHCAFEKQYLGPQPSLQLLQFLPQKHIVILLSPFINNHLEKSKLIKLSYWRKNTKEQRQRAMSNNNHIFIFIYLYLVSFKHFRTVTDGYIHRLRDKISSKF